MDRPIFTKLIAEHGKRSIHEPMNSFHRICLRLVAPRVSLTNAPFVAHVRHNLIHELLSLVTMDPFGFTKLTKDISKQRLTDRLCVCLPQRNCEHPAREQVQDR